MVLPILESNTSDQLAPLDQALAIFQEYRDSRGEWIALLGERRRDDWGWAAGDEDFFEVKPWWRLMVTWWGSHFFRKPKKNEDMFDMEIGMEDILYLHPTRGQDSFFQLLWGIHERYYIMKILWGFWGEVSWFSYVMSIIPTLPISVGHVRRQKWSTNLANWPLWMHHPSWKSTVTNHTAILFLC